MNLKRLAFVGSVWSLLSIGGQQFIAFFLFLYIARNLTPADIGLITLAMIVIEIAGFVSRVGQVETLQRQADISDRLVSTSFWMLAASGALATGLILAAVALAPRQTAADQFLSVLALLAPLCALQAWNAIPEALLKRRFDYRSLAVRTWLGTLLGGGVGVYLAVNGAGVYALVAQRLTSSAIQTITLWTMLRWRPQWAFDKTESMRLIRVGSGILFANLSSIINRRVVDGITGAMLGLSQLGSFRLGWRFNEFIVQFSVTPLASVALTTFSRMQHDLERLQRAYLRLTQFIALASLPMFFGLGATADLLVPVLLGEKWSQSIIVMQLLGFVMLGGTVNYFFASALIAVGKVNVVVRQSTVQIVGTAILVAIGAQFGIVGVVLAIIVRTSTVAIYNVTALNREIGLDVLDLLRALLPPVIASGIMVAAVRFGMLELAGAVPDLVLLVVLVAIGVTTYAAALFLGDLFGLWRGYLRGALASLAGAAARGPTPTMLKA